LVREHINEKFTSDSDPIKDMGIGGISIEEMAQKTIRNKKLKGTAGLYKWREYLNSLVGKKITGKFVKFSSLETRKTNIDEYTFIIRDYYSFYGGTEVGFKDDKENNYVAIQTERYVIR
jgi:hypothetical protein